MHLERVAEGPTKCPDCGMEMVPSKGKFYCPMHPEEVSDAPGNCSICGMELAPISEGASTELAPCAAHPGPHSHHEHMAEDFKRRFFVSVALTIPVLLYSPTVQGLFRFKPPTFPGSEFVGFLFATAVFLYGGMPFLKGFWEEMRLKRPGMMTLVALAITVAFSYSTASTFFVKGKEFFRELATMIDVMLLGHWIEMRSVPGASRALETIARLLPHEAHLVQGDHVMDVPLERLKPGDLVLVKPGERIPLTAWWWKGGPRLTNLCLRGSPSLSPRDRGAESWRAL